MIQLDMDTTKFFKNLIMIDAILLGVMIILSAFEPVEYIDFMSESISLINTETFDAITFIALFLFIVSLFLSYKLKNLGRSLYLLSTIIMLLIMPISDVASTGLSYSIGSFGSMISGVLIYLMYFSEIKDKFN